MSTQEQIAKTQASIQIESNKVQVISVLPQLEHNRHLDWKLAVKNTGDLKAVVTAFYLRCELSRKLNQTTRTLTQVQKVPAACIRLADVIMRANNGLLSSDASA